MSLQKCHFAQLCRTKAVQEVTEVEGPVQTFYLSTVTCDESEPAWRETLETQGGPIDVKLDSGADITVVAEPTWKKMIPKPKLQPVQTKLTSPGGPLTCIGQFLAKTKVQNLYIYRVIVTKSTTSDNMLARGVAVKMGLIKRTDEVQEINEPASIGLLKCKPVKIVLKDSAVPYSVSTARRVPISLLPKVKVELQRMECSMMYYTNCQNQPFSQSWMQQADFGKSLLIKTVQNSLRSLHPVDAFVSNVYPLVSPVRQKYSRIGWSSCLPDSQEYILDIGRYSHSWRRHN